MTFFAAHTRQSLTASSESVEICDAQGRPLLRVPLATAIRQRLPFSLALLALADRNNCLLLHKRPPGPLGAAGAWDLFTGPLLPDETGEDAAIRLFTDAVKILPPADLMRVAHSPALPERPVHLFLFRCFLPTGIVPDHDELLRVDEDELTGLAAQDPDLFAPTLLWASATGMLFQGKNGNTSAFP